ncbi:hypothetical protein SOP96_19315, partial [Chryseobacterium sp. T9W2-O]|nr:hypothetical protein [Chryseobacterium sp. T9W2-O]
MYIVNDFCDTDSDGVPNRLDLDSDNDGCLDAIDGDASVIASQLVTAVGTVTVGTGSTASNQNLGNTVNANGIPQLVSVPYNYSNTTGQGIGASQTASISGCAAPGGVLNGLTRWHKADAGVTTATGVSAWVDQSSATTISQATAANQPVYNTTANLINFNSTITFDGSNDDLLNNISGLPQGATASTFYFVDRPTASNTSRYAFGYGATSGTASFQAGPAGTFTTKQGGGSAFASQTNAYTVNIPSITRTGYDGTRAYLSHNAATEVLSTVYTQNVSTNAFAIGARSDGAANFFTGDIPEVIAYGGKSTASELIRIESYLAIKYGITKTGDYQNSSSAVIWDATANTGYNNNIAGIMRDDASALSQKQSQSVNSGLQPVIGNVNITGTNANNTNNFSADLSALVWGSDTGSTSFATSFVFGGLTARMARIWRVQETGTVGTVKVALPVSQVQGNAAQLNLVVSADATIDGSDTRTAMTLETLGGVQYYTATVDFTTGQFFTFAALATAPGGVFANLRIWLKADDGFTPSSWADRSGNSNDFTQTNASRQPNLIAAGTKYNFNPTVNFGTTGSDARFMVVPSGRPFTANGLDGTFLLTINQNTNSGFRDYLGFGGTTTGSGLTNANDPVFTSNDNGNRTFRIFPYSGATSTTNLQLTAGITYISDVTWRVGVAGGITYGLNGFNGSSGNTFTAGNSLGFNGGILGAQPEVSDAFMSEVIAYERALTAAEMQRVRTYLSIKYGTTLDQSTAQNYLASDGTTIFWNATTNAAYKNNIAGIGRDDTSTLNQKQSQSINSGTQVVIGNGSIAASNAANTNNFSADLSALVWGSDTGSTSFATSFVFGGLNNRMARIWKMQKTGTVGTVKVALPASQIGSIGQLSLVTSSDATFDGTDT